VAARIAADSVAAVVDSAGAPVVAAGGPAGVRVAAAAARHARTAAVGGPAQGCAESAIPTAVAAPGAGYVEVLRLTPERMAQ